MRLLRAFLLACMAVVVCAAHAGTGTISIGMQGQGQNRNNIPVESAGCKEILPLVIASVNNHLGQAYYPGLITCTCTKTTPLVLYDTLSCSNGFAPTVTALTATGCTNLAGLHTCAVPSSEVSSDFGGSYTGGGSSGGSGGSVTGTVTAQGTVTAVGTLTVAELPGLTGEKLDDYMLLFAAMLALLVVVSLGRWLYSYFRVDLREP